MVSGIYSFGPGLFWDSLSVVGEGGFVHVADNDAGCGPTSCTRQLTYTRDESALSTLAIIHRNNIISGWDLSMQVSYSQMIDGQRLRLSGFCHLLGPHTNPFG